MKHQRKRPIAKELELIRKQHRGILRPKDVVAFARNPKTALHSRFEWDDTKAAIQHRLERARHLIRFTLHLIAPKRPPVHVYWSLETDRRRGDSYRETVEVMTDEKLRKQALGRALRDAEAWQQRYQQLVELQPVFRAIARLRKNLKKGRKKR